MTPKDVLSLAAFAFVLLLGAGGVIAASQGRGIDVETGPMIATLGAGLTAGALGVVVGRRTSRRDTPKDEDSQTKREEDPLP